jgi:hypothetical protein
MNTQGIPAGWYPNPEGAGERYWDGQQWTEQYRSAERAAAFPAAAQPQQSWWQRNRAGLLGVAGVAVGLVVLGSLADNGSTSEDATSTPPAVVATEPAPVVERDDPAPKPEPTEDALDQQELNALALDLTWDAMSRSERDLMCTGWYMDPEMMWESFDNGADGSISRAAFMKFMRGKC